MFKAIVYNKVPTCKNCKHYSVNKKDSVPECKLFQHSLNGKKYYELQYVVRENEEQCGIYGAFYDLKNDIYKEILEPVYKPFQK